MTTTTDLHGLGTYTAYTTLTDLVDEFLGEHSKDFDVPALVDAVRDALNDQLDGTTIVLHGDQFYADYPAPEDARDLITAALEAVDLDALAAAHDRSAP